MTTDCLPPPIKISGSATERRTFVRHKFPCLGLFRLHSLSILSAFVIHRKFRFAAVLSQVDLFVISRNAEILPANVLPRRRKVPARNFRCWCTSRVISWSVVPVCKCLRPLLWLLLRCSGALQIVVSLFPLLFADNVLSAGAVVVLCATYAALCSLVFFNLFIFWNGTLRGVAIARVTSCSDRK